MPSLPGHVVGLDIETTALDPSGGEIIEVVAIRYELAGGREIGRFEQLCSLAGQLSEEITALTGITAEMLAGKPTFREIKDKLGSFIGNDYMLAHNASFDLNWLAYHGLPLKNPVWDTFPLAAVAWPAAASYNLGMLAVDYGVHVTTEHRAAADITLTWQIFQKLRQELVTPAHLQARIIDILQKANLSHYVPLFSFHDEVKSEVKPPTNPFLNDQVSQGSLAGVSVEDVLGEAGRLEQAVSGFKIRSAQLAMARRVEEAIAKQEQVFIEAGTGTGKTYAYLVPLLLRLGQDVKAKAYISTYTKALQDQLCTKDIPQLQVALESQFTVAMLKGRRNYVCRHRLESYQRRGAFSAEEGWVLLKIFLWLGRGGNGDLEQLNFSHQGQVVLAAIHADHPACRQHCTVLSGCAYQQAAQMAHRAQLVVVNHALLLQMGQSGRSAHPFTVRVLVIDEAHHLEEAARSAARLDFTPLSLSLIVAGVCRRTFAKEGTALLRAYRQWLGSAAALVQSQAGARGRLLLNRAARGGGAWHKLSQAGYDWLASFKLLVGRAQSQASKDWLIEAQQFMIQFEQFLAGSGERITWIEGHQGEAQLCDTALSVIPYMEGVRQLSPALIFTSATLLTNGTMIYIKSNLGFSEAGELVLPSPYNNIEQMLIYMVEDGVEPTSSSFDQYTAKIIAGLGKMLSGRLLALFTSHRSLKSVYIAILNPLRRLGIKVLAQDLTGGRSRIGSRFRDVHHSVLLGTNSFWEGIDVPGESLSSVVIPKLPFPAVDDPILLTLSEQVGRGAAFDRVIMPHMLLRLRQGVGRLIRSETDRGVVIILDRRVTDKSYGQSVFRSLPAAMVQVGSYKNLGSVVMKWFGKKTLEQWRMMVPKL